MLQHLHVVLRKITNWPLTQVFDKVAFVEAREKSRRVVKDQDRTKRHSSLEPSEVDHLESSMGGVYAVVNKLPKKKSNREVSDLLSTAVRAQLPLDATEQIGSWRSQEEEEEEEERDAHTNNSEAVKPDHDGYVQVDFQQEKKEPHHKHGQAEEKKDPRKQLDYAQLNFHDENGIKKGKIGPEASPTASSRVDTGKTKFGYSTVIFEKNENKDMVESRRQNKPVPQPPPKYEGSGHAMSKHSSDSRLLYSDIDHSKMNQQAISSKKFGDSAPDLSQSARKTNDSGYVNVRFTNAPIVPPRRGAAAIPEETS